MTMLVPGCYKKKRNIPAGAVLTSNSLAARNYFYLWFLLKIDMVITDLARCESGLDAWTIRRIVCSWVEVLRSGLFAPGRFFIFG